MKLLKKSILLSLVAPLLFSLLSFTNAVGGGEVVTIRVYEEGATGSIIIYSNGTTSKTKLDTSSRDKVVTTISQTLEQYLKAGFKVETSNSAHTGSTNTGIMTTYILTK
ncbi:hypothetical protein I5M27_11560 [Adhaeribacter sp. BT258]|uniref:Uncharacterized protein n=1 Tax=Adhaeribacter terrigena TaxID=2793070 RepID=A0ABS1C509_9BACT|nr:hypothetical protein [Adhaeribacter terrigena]MBK0403625.1 hypothetical protein [Adhaeribacter terrigena]